MDFARALQLAFAKFELLCSTLDVGTGRGDEFGTWATHEFVEARLQLCKRGFGLGESYNFV